MLHKLFLCASLFLWYNLNSSTITISKISDMISLSYEFPSIVPDNWIKVKSPVWIHIHVTISFNNKATHSSLPIVVY